MLNLCITNHVKEKTSQSVTLKIVIADGLPTKMMKTGKP